MRPALRKLRSCRAGDPRADIGIEADPFSADFRSYHAETLRERGDLPTLDGGRIRWSFSA
jgi:hypothetical protein